MSAPEDYQHFKKSETNESAEQTEMGCLEVGGGMIGM